MAATRRAGFNELLALTMARLDRQLVTGTTTTEAKSGYGLDLESELKQLRVLREAARRHPVEIVPTAMPGHEVPPEWRHDPDAYVELVVREIHPAIAAEGLAEGVDVFCEQGVFSPDQTRRLLADAPRYRWRIHLHADELSNLGGAELAAELGAASASHLLHVSDAGIAALARAGVVAVALPGVSFFLRDRYAPVRRLVAAGVPVALASDCNPGSSHTESMAMIMALGCLGAGLVDRGGAGRGDAQRRRRPRPGRPPRLDRAGQAGRPRRPRRPVAQAPRLPLRRQPRPPRRQGRPGRRPRRRQDSQQLTADSSQLPHPPDAAGWKSEGLSAVSCRLPFRRARAWRATG